MNIYEKLANARADFKAAGVKMSGNNSFVGYKYFDLSDILPKTTELEKKYKMLSIVTFGKETAELNIINAEAPEEKVTFISPMSTAELKGCHPVQNLGAAESYVRRYLYLAAYEIVESDTLDLTQGKEELAPADPTPKASAPAAQQAKQYNNAAPTDVTLEQAYSFSFKKGKNANVPFKELPDEALEWAAANLTGAYGVGAKLVLDARYPVKETPVETNGLPFEEKEEPNGLPF